MPQKRWIVWVDWVDGDTEDTDEVCVHAESAARAKAAARKRWTDTNGAEWPDARIQSVRVATKALIERYCY
jgi:hypothetical protein